MIIIVVIGLFNSAFVWAPEEQITDDDFWDTNPCVMQTRNGTIWVVWSSDHFASYDLFCKTYNGSSWSTETRRLTWHSGFEDDPSIIETQDGKIWLVYQSDRNGNYDIFCMISSDGGLSWSSSFQLTYDLRHDSAPSITQNLDGKIWVVWQRKYTASNNDLVYRTYDGSSWSAEARLTESSTWDMSPSITWTYNGTVWVFWSLYNLTGSQYDLFYKTYNGSSWSAEPARLTTDPDWDSFPSAIQCVDGTMWVVWSSDRGGKYSLYYKTYNMSTMAWSSDALLLKLGYDYTPSATGTKDRRIWVVWETGFDIYYTISDEINSVHDVALTDIIVWASSGFSPTWVPRGVPIYINVTVENQGTFNETFDVSVYAENNVGDEPIDIGTQNIFLTVGANTTLSFTWDTSDTPYGTYYIGAEATMVLGEYDTADNIIMAGSKIGGICVPIRQPHVSILDLLAPIASATLATAALGIAAIGFFKTLMSPRLRWSWHLSRVPPAKYTKTKWLATAISNNYPE